MAKLTKETFDNYTEYMRATVKEMERQISSLNKKVAKLQEAVKFMGEINKDYIGVREYVNDFLIHCAEVLYFHKGEIKYARTPINSVLSGKLELVGCEEIDDCCLLYVKSGKGIFSKDLTLLLHRERQELTDITKAINEHDNKEI